MTQEFVGSRISDWTRATVAGFGSELSAAFAEFSCRGGVQCFNPKHDETSDTLLLAHWLPLSIVFQYNDLLFKKIKRLHFRPRMAKDRAFLLISAVWSAKQLKGKLQGCHLRWLKTSSNHVQLGWTFMLDHKIIREGDMLIEKEN